MVDRGDTGAGAEAEGALADAPPVTVDDCALSVLALADPELAPEAEAEGSD